MYFKMFATIKKNKWRNPILTVYGLELEKVCLIDNLHPVSV